MNPIIKLIVFNQIAATCLNNTKSKMTQKTSPHWLNDQVFLTSLKSLKDRNA